MVLKDKSKKYKELLRTADNIITLSKTLTNEQYDNVLDALLDAYSIEKNSLDKTIIKSIIIQVILS